METVDRLLRLKNDATYLLSREGGVPGGMTALHCACSGGHDGVVRLLLLAAPYARLLLETLANRPDDIGPAETPRELATRLAQGIVSGGRWRKIVVAIDQAIEDDRQRSQLTLGEALTLLSTGNAEDAMQRARFGLKCDPGNTDLTGILQTSVAVLVGEMEEQVASGDAQGAFAVAELRVGLAPEIEPFRTLYHLRHISIYAVSALEWRAFAMWFSNCGSDVS